MFELGVSGAWRCDWSTPEGPVTLPGDGERTEAGRRNPSYLLLLQIAYALQTRLRDLFPQDELRPEPPDESD